MADNENQEILGTLEEINQVAGTLSSDLTDKKAISDIMLAIEKVQQSITDICQPKIGRLCQSISLLYEKFLMESVDDAGPGIEKSAEGISLIRAAINGEKSPGELDREGDEISDFLSDKYELDLPSAPAVAGTENESGTEDEDDFFEGQPAPEPLDENRFDDLPNRYGEHDSPSAQKISGIAGMITELDTDMTDKKVVSDLILAFDEIAKEMFSTEGSEQGYRLSSALSGIFEMSLMSGLDDGALALELASDGVTLLGSYYGKIESAEEFSKRADEAAEEISSRLGVSLPEKTELPAGSGEASSDRREPEEPPASSPADENAGGSSGVTAVAPTSVTIGTEDDLLLYTEFASETTDTLAAIEEGLMDLEDNPSDMDIINTIFRSFHSLKGAAGFLGISTINVLCHECESLLDKLRKKTVVFNQAMTEALLQSVDVIKIINEQMAENTQESKKSLPDAELSLPRYEIDTLLVQLVQSEKGEIEEDAVDEEQLRLGDLLLSKHLVTQNQLDSALGSQKPIGEILLETGAISKDQLEKALAEQKPVGKILVEMGAVEERVVAGTLKEQSVKKRKAAVASLKVDTEKLDSLLELVGELVISQSIVSQDTALANEGNRPLQKNLLNLGKITKSIQDHVMNLRMVPLRQTFQKMSRLVRDLSKKMKKPVNFEMTGEDTEIDKTLIEELSDPLVHLMRNALDHGIESPQEREDKGKSRVGNVKLSAFHKGGNVYIEIKDDGAGIDPERVRLKAIEKGMIDEDQVLSEQEIFNLLLMPGFSTAKQVTDVSGRGVGMDVVRSNVDKLGGKIELASQFGRGMVVTVKLPLTMAIVDGMIVSIGDDRFIIPTISIRESIRPTENEIITVKAEGEMINIRGRLLPLVRLHNRLKIGSALYTSPWEGLVIIVESDDREYGLMVDDLLGQQQVVIKSLGNRFKGLPGISGGTILGDGRVGLILDVAGLVSMN